MDGTRKSYSRAKRPAHERFWEKVDVRGPGDCWLWLGHVSDTGYGQFWDGTRLVKAHRFVVRDISPGDEVDHACHNGTGCLGGPSCAHRACVNPLHLQVVTHRENVQRGMAGRQSVGWATRCLRGHLYDDANTYIDPDGHQRCRECARDRARGIRKQEPA